MKQDVLMNDDESTLPTEGAIPADPTPPKRRRGFAAMDRSVVREIAQKGGLAAHARGTAHEFTSEEARAAGRKGGTAPHRSRGRKPSHREVTETGTPNTSP